MASVNGSRIKNWDPSPGVEFSSTVPRNFSTPFFTTSMPTPRPETSVILSTVEKPGRKIKLFTS